MYAKLNELKIIYKIDKIEFIINNYININLYLSLESKNILINFFKDILEGKECHFFDDRISLLSNKENISIYNDDFKFSFENSNIFRNELRILLKKLNENNLDNLKKNIVIEKIKNKMIEENVKIFNDFYWSYNDMLIPKYIKYVLANDQRSYIYQNGILIEYDYKLKNELPLYLSKDDYLNTYAVFNNQTQKYYFKPHIKDYNCITLSSREEKYFYQILFILEEENDIDFYKIKNNNVIDLKNDLNLNCNILKKLEKIEILKKNYDIIENLKVFLEEIYKNIINYNNLEYTSLDFVQL